MLSRVADAMFWMSRYIERAEHVARLLEVAVHLDLELHGVGAGSQELHWEALLSIVQQQPPETADGLLAAAVNTSLTFDVLNASSIMTSINRVRGNARSIRGSISSDVWRELNKLYWQLMDSEFRNRAQEAPHELYQAVQTGSHMFQGVCDATLIHDEGWRFIQLGKYLERAEKTLRVLDTRQRQLSALADSMELSLLNLHWASVLKSCQAYQSYQQLYISRVEPERVLEFLLFNPDFPFSVRFCLQAAAEHLAAIDDGDRSGGRAARILGRTVLDLEYAEPGTVLNGELRPFMDMLGQRCAAAALAVQEQYSLS
jgi:uncharacterized alpha-E superfamily protein